MKKITNGDVYGAVIDSIKHWGEIKAEFYKTFPEKKKMLSVNVGRTQCPLCSIFNHDFLAKPCVGCPIFNRTGKTRCAGTPYQRLYELWNHQINRINWGNAGHATIVSSQQRTEWEPLVNEEITLLVSLLPNKPFNPNATWKQKSSKKNCAG